jgi:heme exporter protein D
VAVAVTVVMLLVLVATYAGTGVLMLRSMHDERARERVRRLRAAPILVLLITPLVLTAAHPWGPATIALGFGLMVGCQAFLHGMIVVQAIRHGRARPGASQ